MEEIILTDQMNIVIFKIDHIYSFLNFHLIVLSNVLKGIQKMVIKIAIQMQEFLILIFNF